MGYSRSTLALDSELLYNIGMFLTINSMQSNLIFKPRLSAYAGDAFLGLKGSSMQKFQANLQRAGTKSVSCKLISPQSVLPSLLYPFATQKIFR